MIPRPIYLDDTSWRFDDVLLQEWVSDGSVDLPLSSADFDDDDHSIVISFDDTGVGSGNGVVEGDESNNNTFVEVHLPPTIPANEYETVRCSPP